MPNADCDALARSFDLLARAVETNTERLAGVEQELARLVEALAPREGGPDPLHDALERIVGLIEGCDGKLDTILARLHRPNGGAAP